MKLNSYININRIVILAVATVVVVYLINYSEPGGPPIFRESSLKTNTKPDYFLVNSISTQFSKHGQIESVAISDRVEHNPDGDSINLSNPHFQLHKEGALTWNVNASYGVVFPDSDEVRLKQQVTIVSADEQTSLKTPQLTIFPNKQRAQTDKAVTLYGNSGFTRAVGMRADLDNKQIHLLSEVIGQYDPQVLSGN